MLKALRLPTDRDALVFGTSTGGKENDSNVRNRMLTPDVWEANSRLAEKGRLPIRTRPEGATTGARFTPHSFGRTYASLLYIEGRDPSFVKRVMGHKHAALSLTVYALMETVDEDVRARWRAFVATGSTDLRRRRRGAPRTQAP